MKKSTQDNSNGTSANNKKKGNASEAEKEDPTQEPDSIELPDVKDIPGQEHIRPPKMKEFRDTTISSSDEEGDDIFDEDEELLDEDSNITPEELELLDTAGESDTDDERMRHTRLDEVDEDGDPLNEEGGLDGDDLDVPGAEDDDADEALGEEDEENNQYSVDKENEEEDPNANSNI